MSRSTPEYATGVRRDWKTRAGVGPGQARPGPESRKWGTHLLQVGLLCEGGPRSLRQVVQTRVAAQALGKADQLLDLRGQGHDGVSTPACGTVHNRRAGQRRHREPSGALRSWCKRQGGSQVACTHGIGCPKADAVPALTFICTNESGRPRSACDNWSSRCLAKLRIWNMQLG